MPDLIKSRHLISYFISRVKATSVWGVIDRVIKYSRRFFLIGRIIKYLGIVITVIETSAALIVIAAIIVVLVPLTLVALIVFAVANRIIGSRVLKSRALSEYLERGRVYVIAQAGTFGEGFAKELADNSAAVFVVTWDPSHRFISAEYRDGVYYLRHAFFFRLKRKRFGALGDKLTYLL